MLVFALVTRSGWLIAYNYCLAGRALLKISAHSVDATALDWHPLKANIIATGGAADRCVKIWDLEVFLSFLTPNNNIKDESNLSTNANTFSSRGDSVLSESSGNESYK
jgi:WD40 repeat protein